MERTLIIVKPDGVQRGLVGEILARFERKGYRVVGLKITQMSRQLAETHYDVHKDKPFFGELVDYITSAPVVPAVIEGPEVISAVRKMVGKTRPYEAEPGSIRGDYGVAGLRNLIHASDAPDTAAREIALYFKESELLTYTRDVDKWIYED
jgi:nucleoside-diphosphate kinase